MFNVIYRIKTWELTGNQTAYRSVWLVPGRIYLSAVNLVFDL